MCANESKIGEEWLSLALFQEEAKRRGTRLGRVRLAIKIEVNRAGALFAATKEHRFVVVVVVFAFPPRRIAPRLLDSSSPRRRQKPAERERERDRERERARAEEK